MKARSNSFLLVMIVVVASIAASYFIATANVLIGALIILGVIGFFVVTAIVFDFRIGVYILFDGLLYVLCFAPHFITNSIWCFL